MTKIMSNSKEPTVAYRHEYATEAHNEFEEYPFIVTTQHPYRKLLVNKA